MKGLLVSLIGSLLIGLLLLLILFNKNREGFSNVIDYFNDVSAGGHHTIILTKNNGALACGYNRDGRLGTGDTNSIIAPIPVSFPSNFNVTHIFTGNSSTFFIVNQNNENRVYASGNNDTFKLGIDQSSEMYYVPTEITYFRTNKIKIVKISAGWNHTLFLSDDHKVYGCGSNNVGQLGTDISFSISMPTLISFPDIKITDISANSLAHSVFLDDNGIVYTCGWNWYGQLGNGTKANSFTPKALTFFTNKIKSIFTGATITFFISEDNKIYMCGQITLTNKFESTIPVFIDFPTSINITSIAVGLNHTVFLSDKGVPYLVGDNSYGQLGTGNNQDSSIPIIPSYFTNRPNLTVHKVTAGNYHTLFLTNENVLLATGLNNTGQLGIGNQNITTRNVPTPCNIPIETPSAQISYLKSFGYTE